MPCAGATVATSAADTAASVNISWPALTATAAAIANVTASTSATTPRPVV
jgi:hypothetical protein